VDTDRHIDQLGDFVQAAPSPFHAVAESVRLLRDAGFTEVAEADRWSLRSGGRFLVRDGTVIAWWEPAEASATTPFRVVGAHTDSPTFKLKPRPTTGTVGWLQAGVEVYGGPLLNSWLDRELALAGRLVTRSGESVLVRTGPMLRIPQLAIHLDRTANTDGVKLDAQRHTAPIWGLGDPDTADLVGYLADCGGVAATDVLGYDIVAADTQPPAVFGGAGEFFASGRLDNLSSVHAGLRAMLAVADDPPADAIAVLAAFDHEETGSASFSGAAGPVLGDVLDRISRSLGAEADEAARARAGSVCLSADAGHAVHPNYPERHDPVNRPIVNAGPLLKINANQRYATDAVGAAVWVHACERAGVPTQEFVSNNAIPCGSTIGPITAARTGIRTVDVGTPLLSMHSAREMCGVRDPGYLASAMHSFYAGPSHG
jgi:aspartyl aminopeptidase